MPETCKKRTPTLANALIPKAVTRLRKPFKEASVELFTQHSREMLNSILLRETDIGLTLQEMQEMQEMHFRFRGYRTPNLKSPPVSERGEIRPASKEPMLATATVATTIEAMPRAPQASTAGPEPSTCCR